LIYGSVHDNDVVENDPYNSKYTSHQILNEIYNMLFIVERKTTFMRKLLILNFAKLLTNITMNKKIVLFLYLSIKIILYCTCQIHSNTVSEEYHGVKII